MELEVSGQSETYRYYYLLLLLPFGKVVIPIEIERETWRQVCQQLGSRKTSDDQAAAPLPAEAPKPPHTDMSPREYTLDQSASPGLSLEA